MAKEKSIFTKDVVLGKQAAQTVAQHSHPGKHLRNCLRLVEAVVPVGGFAENLI